MENGAEKRQLSALDLVALLCFPLASTSNRPPIYAIADPSHAPAPSHRGIGGSVLQLGTLDLVGLLLLSSGLYVEK
uniref:Uncharacterized protein n=1 Tax=Oryza glumipatula TaxID=40148 RepID=A0A0D9ZYK8_9ORYZ